MAYSSTLQLVQRSGIGKKAYDENVGTGDNSATAYDLDNDNVIASSYSLGHAASGSNGLTALTETTHYTIDVDSGRITLTAAGVTALGTDILYATYWYTDNFTNTVLGNLIDASDDEVDLLTGRKWDTATAVVEYYDGKSQSTYPTTDYPYQEDYDSPGWIILDNKPVSTVRFVYFLADSQPVSKAFNYDDGTSAYTDITTNVNSTTESPVDAFNASPAATDIIYIGGANVFLGLTVDLSTLGVDGGTTAIDWEYYNGTAWTDLTETDTQTGASLFTASGTFTWTYPYGWAQNAVNGTTAYWIRGRLTTANYTTDPTISSITIRDSVSTVVEPRQYKVDSRGRLIFSGVDVPNGVRNLRVDYSYGQATTPSYIVDLSIVLASIRAFVYITGGSFDDATSYTLGSKSVTIGEAYVNVREVLDQLKKRRSEILDSIGRRVDIIAI